MMKRILGLITILVFMSSSLVLAAEAKDPLQLEKTQPGLKNILCGIVETPDNIDATKSKGTPAFPDCTDKTKSGFGRMLVRVVGGAFQVATFWYPKDQSTGTKAVVKKTSVKKDTDAANVKKEIDTK